VCLTKVKFIVVFTKWCSVLVPVLLYILVNSNSFPVLFLMAAMMSFLPFSASPNRLLVPSTRLSTVGGRDFSDADPSISNNLPDNVTSALTLSTFCQWLKTSLFALCLCPSLTLHWTDGPYLTDSSSSSDLY